MIYQGGAGWKSTYAANFFVLWQQAVTPAFTSGIAGLFASTQGEALAKSYDVVKALGLGATGVDIGRPYVWGLASFSESGVDRVLEILDAEFVTIMRQVAALNVAQITRRAIGRA